MKFDHIVDESGQSLGTVRQIFQDKMGFVWLGTEAGLKRYDGNTFKAFTYDVENPSSISSLNITSIAASHQGELWIGTDNGLNRYDAAKETFQRFYQPSPSCEEPCLVDNAIRCLLFDKENSLWIGTKKGLSKFNLQRNTFEVFTRNISAQKAIQGNEIGCLFQDYEGYIWISLLGKGLAKYHPLQERMTLYRQSDRRMMNLPSDFVQAVFQDSQKNLWIATDIGLCLYDRAKDGFVYYSQHTQLQDKSITCLYEDLYRNLWIGTASNGLWKLDAKTKLLHNFTSNTSNPLSLRSNRIWSIVEDKTGILWIGTADGLHKNYKRAEAFIVLHKEPDEPNTLPDNVVNTFYQDERGNYWIGTTQGVTCCFPHANHTSFTFENYHSGDFAFLKKEITKIIEDKQGRVWVGGNDGEVAFIDLQRKVKRLNTPNSSFFSLIGKDAIHDLLIDCQGQIWIGSAAGLFKLDAQQLTIELVPLDAERIETIHVTKLFEEKCKALWIGTQGQGLIRLEYATGDITKYIYTPNQSGTLSNNTVHDIYADRNGTIWVGTHRGLNKFDAQKETFQVFTEEDGLAGNIIKSIVEDKRGRLWLGTNNGLCRFDTYYLQFKNFDMRDGLPSNLFNVRAALLSKEGRMLFGTYGGLLMFSPDSVLDDTSLPSVLITDFKVIDPSVSTQDKKRIHRPLDLAKPIYETQEIVLQPDDKIFTIRMAALHYAAPDKNQFAYKLEGFDKDWIYTFSQKEVSYMNLPPGEYIFRVKASNHDGYWNNEGTSLKIIITPALYERWWFRLLSVLGLGGLVYLGYALRVKQIQLQKQTLEKTVAMRTAQLAEEKRKVEAINEEIKRQNQELALKTEEIQQQKEEILTQKEYIQQKNSLLEEAQKTIEEQNQRLLLSNQELELKVKERTQELIKTYDELIKTNAQIDNLLYRTAHDIKGPIARILGLCQVAQLENPNGQLKTYFSRMEKEGKEMDKMLSRMNRAIEIKNISVDYLYPIQFEHTIWKVINKLKETEEVERVNVIVEIENGVECESDERLIEILMECLLSNAIRYRDERKEYRYVKVSVSNNPFLEQVEIIVEDNGIGIPKELQEKVFDMFFIGTTQSKGHGLGLFEAKLIVDKLEGSITLLREDNQPTIFKVCIPSNTEDRKKL